MKCPKCGKAVIEGGQDFDKVLLGIKDVYGIEIFKDTAGVISAVSEIMPNNRKEINLLKTGLESGIYQKFEEIKKDESKETSNLRACSVILEEEYYVNKKGINKLIELFIKLFETERKTTRYEIMSISEIVQAVLHGDQKAGYRLGCMYFNGESVYRDYIMAEILIRSSAESGVAEAQNMLGNMYNSGNGVEYNTNKSLYWYRKAAEQGLAEAQNNLGDMYFYGKGTEVNKEKAAEWYRISAGQGNETAKKSLEAMNMNAV